MDPLIISNKFDEFNKRFEKLENENKLLKNEITSLKKLIGAKLDSEQILKEKIFVSHKKHIDFITTNFTPEYNIVDIIKTITIQRDMLLRCFELFESGVCGIIDYIISEKFPMISMTFSRKNYIYLYNNTNNWVKSNDKDITDFIQKIILGPLFTEFTKWQNENKNILKSDAQSTKYHNILMLLMNTPQSVLVTLRKHMITKIKCIN
jgi:hypothetical protein|tara:strand:- start:3641 stop:4261 length:621 start_codon:yes stop_codon:yes gene_type:complete